MYKLFLALLALALSASTVVEAAAKYNKCFIFAELHNGGTCDQEFEDFNRYVFNWHVCPCEELYCYKSFQLEQYCENFTGDECKSECISYVRSCCDYHPDDCKTTGHVQPPMMAIRGARKAGKTNHHGY